MPASNDILKRGSCSVPRSSDVMDRAQTFLRFGVDKLQPDHFAVVDQCVANLQSQTVDRKDDRLKNAYGVVV